MLRVTAPIIMNLIIVRQKTTAPVTATRVISIRFSGSQAANMLFSLTTVGQTSDLA